MLIHGRYNVLSRLDCHAGETPEIDAAKVTVVYRVRDDQTGRLAALKVLRSPYGANATFKALLEREYQILRTLSHPNIIETYDLVLGEHESFIVMEFAGDQTVHDLAGKLAFEEALRVLLVVAETLRDLHNLGFLYCDLKPQNLVIANRDSLIIKFVDFELALPLDNNRAERAGPGRGTLGFMSPEQIHREVLGPSADVYSFGILAYQLWTGQLPYPDGVDLEHWHSMVPAPDLKAANPQVPARANDFVDRCLRKSPQARYQSFEEVLVVLRAVSARAPWHERLRRYLTQS